jgi:NAD(P)-dependent dehydrogenase (short-subunit alcohol dehydrogenase family)
MALVTGAGRGVGQGIALELAREGCHVAVNFHEEPERAEATAASVRGFGVRAVTVYGDVRRPVETQHMVAETVEQLGGLTILVNNAGVQTWGPLLEVTEEQWDLVLDTNLKGCFFATQAAARYMKAHGGGVIVNIGSGSNKVPFPDLSAYTASKGGIEMLTKVAAAELGPFGIRVNCVAPGAIEVERTRMELPDYAAHWGAVTPLRRVGNPRDVGRAAVMLASADAAFVTGQTVGVDGGLFAQPPWPRRDA